MIESLLRSTSTYGTISARPEPFHRLGIRELEKAFRAMQELKPKPKAIRVVRAGMLEGYEFDGVLVVSKWLWDELHRVGDNGMVGDIVTSITGIRVVLSESLPLAVPADSGG